MKARLVRFELSVRMSRVWLQCFCKGHHGRGDTTLQDVMLSRAVVLDISTMDGNVIYYKELSERIVL